MLGIQLGSGLGLELGLGLGYTVGWFKKIFFLQ